MKKTINKKAFVSKPVAAAVGLAMGALVAANAQAVSISNDGIGEVLMFPYYTVNNGYQTNINITNTTADTVAFKIRFRESDNSRDARDFNVVLSPYDVWNAAVVEGPNGVARVQTMDTSCTVGQLQPAAGYPVPGVNFTNMDYIGVSADGGDDTVARTREGHIEVISMGRVLAGGESVVNSVAYNAKHVDTNGDNVLDTPRDCNAVRAAFTLSNIEDTRAQFVAPVNALKGSVSFLNVQSGKAITSEPTVLADFYNVAASGSVDADETLGENLIVLPETQAPGLHDVTPAIAYWLEDDDADATTAPISQEFNADASAPVDAVSALIMRQGVVNQYSVNPGVNAQTDWVITFPTKHYYVDERNPLPTGNATHSIKDGSYYPAYTHLVGEGAARAPFTETFQQNNNACAAVAVQFNFFNREEDKFTVQETAGFSPSEPGQANTICKEVQVITFNQTNLFGADRAANVATGAYNSGWMDLKFPSSAGLADDGTNGLDLDGYPIIGFSATTLENGVAADAMLNYGFSANHGYTRGYVTP